MEPLVSRVPKAVLSINCYYYLVVKKGPDGPYWLFVLLYAASPASMSSYIIFTA